MTFEEYQWKAHATSRDVQIGGSYDLYPVLGLVNEAGELAGKFKKWYRDGAFNQADVEAEMGDVLWYLSELASQLHISLDAVARMNLSKLEDRARRGVIQGSGDNR